MALSPFKQFANSTLKFSVPSSKVVLDEFENPVLVTETLSVTAILKPRSNNLNPQPGADNSQGVFSGYLVEPLELPSTIAPNSKAEITLSGKKGEFTLQPTIPNPYLEAANIKMLTKIEGVVRWL